MADELAALVGWLVSPVRMPTVGSWSCVAEPLGREAMPASGARRFLSTSTARARSGEM